MEVMTKSLHRGTNPQKTECPLQTALADHTLSIVCIYSLITIFMGILYTQKPTLITSLLIMSAGEAGWVWGLFISETKLSDWRKVLQQDWREKFEPDFILSCLRILSLSLYKYFIRYQSFSLPVTR